MDIPKQSFSTKILTTEGGRGGCWEKMFSDSHIFESVVRLKRLKNYSWKGWGGKGVGRTSLLWPGDSSDKYSEELGGLMCVCVCVHVYVCVWVCMHVCVCMSMYVCVCNTHSRPLPDSQTCISAESWGTREGVWSLTSPCGSSAKLGGQLVDDLLHPRVVLVLWDVGWVCCHILERCRNLWVLRGRTGQCHK